MSEAIKGSFMLCECGCYLRSHVEYLELLKPMRDFEPCEICMGAPGCSCTGFKPHFTELVANYG